MKSLKSNWHVVQSADGFRHQLCHRSTPRLQICSPAKPRGGVCLLRRSLSLPFRSRREPGVLGGHAVPGDAVRDSGHEVAEPFRVE